jgi:phospholipid transport system substrate-binding protein
MMKQKLVTVVLAMAVIALGSVSASLASAEPAHSPEDVVREAFELTVQALDQRREELRADREALFELIDSVLLPRWDRQFTGQLVMGRYWREATPEQREAFISGLYRKLLDTYGDGVLQYDTSQVGFTVVGTRGDAAEGRVMVDSQVRLQDGTTVPISYRMRLHDGRWKVFDVVVEGISYVTNFRNQYASEFRSKGVAGVVAELQAASAGS